MIKRKMFQVASIATLGVVGLVLLSRGGPECACSLPASSFSQQAAEGRGDALKSSESAGNSRIVASEQVAQRQEATPLLEIKDVKLAHGVAQGLAVYRPNGKPLAILIRADRGAIVCMHFSLDALEGHRVPAASVQGIKSIEELLETKLVGVNKLASALGVQPGMPVRDALEKMTEGGVPSDEGPEDYTVKAASGRFAQRGRGPLVHVQDIVCSHGTARAIATYRPNGKLLGLLIRADRGAIACMHFSLDAFEGHGVPAASVQGIQSFEKLAENKIVRVNQLASALGVQAGMSVREALDKMMEKGISGNTVREDHAIPTGSASRDTQ